MRSPEGYNPTPKEAVKIKENIINAHAFAPELRHALAEKLMQNQLDVIRTGIVIN